MKRSLNCQHCGEALTFMDLAFIEERHPNMPVHQECGFRSVAGGLNHLLGRCSCRGCTGGAIFAPVTAPCLPPDPPGMSKREAAKLAMNFFMERQALTERYQALADREAKPDK